MTSQVCSRGYAPMASCDFCGAQRPAWRYPARSFFDALGFKSLGDWLACQECHILIAAGEREKLTERSLKHQVPPRIPNGKAWSRLYVNHLHDLFVQHRVGPPRRIAS